MKHDDGSWLMGVFGLSVFIFLLLLIFSAGIFVGQKRSKYAGMTAQEWSDVARNYSKEIGILVDQRNEYMLDYYRVIATNTPEVPSISLHCSLITGDCTKNQ